jgi:hypothetical protein
MACRECEASCLAQHFHDPYAEVWGRISKELSKAAEAMPGVDLDVLKAEFSPERFLLHIHEAGRQAALKEGG